MNSNEMQLPASRATCAALLLLLLSMPAVVQAQFKYTTNNGAITITGYTGSGGAVVIPSLINNLPVRTIGISAFYNKYSLTSVVISTNVTSIGSSAFSHCSGLTNLTIPNSLTNIGDSAFSSCYSLISVPIPNGVTGIGNFAFETCINLASVSIPDSVLSIGAAAYNACINLTNVVIGSGVTNIGGTAFTFGSRLNSIVVDQFNTAFISVDGVLFNKSQTTLIQCPGTKSGSYTIPSSVAGIGAYAFFSCTSLTNVLVGDSVISIGSYGFWRCSSLTGVTIGKNVNFIVSSAFAACTSLAAIAVDPLNPAYRSVDGVLFNKSQTTLTECPGGKRGSYTIPNSVTNIAAGAFQSCTSLTSVVVPNNVTSIEPFTFQGCTSMTSVSIPSSMTSIGISTFQDCVKLSNVYFHGHTPSVDSSAFSGATNATIYYLPNIAGWSPTFGGRPTALWKPQMETTGASFGVRSNQFGFNIAWASGQVVVVEACEDLANPIWSPLQTNTLISDTLYFSDPQWADYPYRFYRLRSP